MTHLQQWEHTLHSRTLSLSHTVTDSSLISHMQTVTASTLTSHTQSHRFQAQHQGSMPHLQQCEHKLHQQVLVQHRLVIKLLLGELGGAPAACVQKFQEQERRQSG